MLFTLALSGNSSVWAEEGGKSRGKGKDHDKDEQGEKSESKAREEARKREAVRRQEAERAREAARQRMEQREQAVARAREELRLREEERVAREQAAQREQEATYRPPPTHPAPAVVVLDSVPLPVPVQPALGLRAEPPVIVEAPFEHLPQGWEQWTAERREHWLGQFQTALETVELHAEARDLVAADKDRWMAVLKAQAWKGTDLDSAVKEVARAIRASKSKTAVMHE